MCVCVCVLLKSLTLKIIIMNKLKLIFTSMFLFISMIAFSKETTQLNLNEFEDCSTILIKNSEDFIVGTIGCYLQLTIIEDGPGYFSPNVTHHTIYLGEVDSFAGGIACEMRAGSYLCIYYGVC